VEEDKNQEQFEAADGDSTDRSENAPAFEFDPEVIAALENELNGCREKRDEYLDGWQRALADFSNYKKRVEREQAESYQTAAVRAARRFLDILDDLELALKKRPKEGEGASWADGIDLIYRKAVGYLESDGIIPMDAEGAAFDPNFHEAIVMEENDDFESGQIIEVLQNGYMQNDRVVRPARVRVAQ
jgi:molecular chaperone GrpE